jgi:hypothetical protein
MDNFIRGNCVSFKVTGILGEYKALSMVLNISVLNGKVYPGLRAKVGIIWVLF